MSSPTTKKKQENARLRKLFRVLASSKGMSGSLRRITNPEQNAKVSKLVKDSEWMAAIAELGNADETAISGLYCVLHETFQCENCKKEEASVGESKEEKRPLLETDGEFKVPDLESQKRIATGLLDFIDNNADVIDPSDTSDNSDAIDTSDDDAITDEIPEQKCQDFEYSGPEDMKKMLDFFTKQTNFSALFRYDDTKIDDVVSVLRAFGCKDKHIVEIIAQAREKLQEGIQYLTDNNYDGLLGKCKDTQCIDSDPLADKVSFRITIDQEFVESKVDSIREQVKDELSTALGIPRDHIEIPSIEKGSIIITLIVIGLVFDITRTGLAEYRFNFRPHVNRLQFALHCGALFAMVGLDGGAALGAGVGAVVGAGAGALPGSAVGAIGGSLAGFALGVLSGIIMYERRRRKNRRRDNCDIPPEIEMVSDKEGWKLTCNFNPGQINMNIVAPSPVAAYLPRPGSDEATDV